MFYPVRTRGLESPWSALHVYSAFQVRPFDKIFNNSLMVRPIKHANCKCHEYLYMFDENLRAR